MTWETPKWILAIQTVGQAEQALRFKNVAAERLPGAANVHVAKVGGFHKKGYPQNGWTPIKTDD